MLILITLALLFAALLAYGQRHHKRQNQFCKTRASGNMPWPLFMEDVQ